MFLKIPLFINIFSNFKNIKYPKNIVITCTIKYNTHIYLNKN